MGKRGPAPMPTVFRLIHGPDKPSRINKAEPKPETGEPPTPDWLNEAAQAHWRRIVPMMMDVGLLTEIDGDVLAAYCAGWARYVQAERDLERIASVDPTTHGILARTSNGTPIVNPMTGVVNHLRRDVARMASELGLTPAGRTQIKVEKPKDASKLEAKYRR